MPNTTSSSVLGVGFIALDIIVNWQENSRPSLASAGGTCGNVLKNLSSLGHQCSAFCRMGEDAASHFVISDLVDSGVDCSKLILEPTRKCPMVIQKWHGPSAKKDHTFTIRSPHDGSHFPQYSAPTLLQTDDLLNNNNLVPDWIFCDRPSPGALRLVRHFRDKGSRLFLELDRFDDKGFLKDMIKLADIVKFSSEKPLREPILYTVDKAINQVLICSRGHEGVEVKVPESETWEQVECPCIPRIQSFDSCGAGDWLSAIILHKMAALNPIDLKADLMKKILTEAQVVSSVSCLYVSPGGLLRGIGKEGVLSLHADNIDEVISRASDRTDESIANLEVQMDDLIKTYHQS